MPEVSEDATILLAISWQALGRAKNENVDAIVCDCTVTLVFAAFYIEANLNHILKTMNKLKEMENFYNLNMHNKYRQLGLQDKLAWFYNYFVAKSVARNRKQLFDKGIKKKLSKKFPGFYKIYHFRNGVSHGHINRSNVKIVNAEKLRSLAKNIVDELFKIAVKSGKDIPRSVSYEEATNNLNVTA